MPNKSNIWALVLAAGDGKRLERLIGAGGGPVIPKQYCSLRPGPSLLHDALRRALAVSSPQHTCVVVAEKHRCWWQSQLGILPPGNVIVQPENRGTGVGILLPLLHIFHRDRRARIVIMPSDHHLRTEARLLSSLRVALNSIRSYDGRTLLLGVTPEEPDPDLGYILAQAAHDEAALRVLKFTEKPSATEALELIGRGALWNTFIIAASVGGLLGLYKRRVPELVTEMYRAVVRDRETAGEGQAVTQLYARLPPTDFSRDILPGQESSIRVVRVQPCGWSDLGTPERVARTLLHPSTERSTSSGASARHLEAQVSPLSLAEQHARHASKPAALGA